MGTNGTMITTRQFTGEIPQETLDIRSLGKGLELISARKQPFSQDLAKKYLSMTSCPWERPLRNNHVIFLVSEMKKKTFLMELTKLASCYCEETATEYRINGQHTNWARLEIEEGEFPTEPVECLRYKAETLNDVRRLYASFDRGTPRTKFNVLNSYLLGTEQFTHTTPTLIKALTEGFSFWMWESPHLRKQHTGDDIAYLLQTQYKDLTAKIIQFAESTPKMISLAHMRKACITGAIFETFNTVQKDSEEFWRCIETGANMTSANDPRLRLRNILMVAGTQKTAAISQKKHIAPETIYRYCITCWNSWRSGEQIEGIRVTKKRMRAK